MFSAAQPSGLMTREAGSCSWTQRKVKAALHILHTMKNIRARQPKRENQFSLFFFSQKEE
ncbi:hypothetical protein AC739_08545 [Planococcus glaciei]|nr:hypothetical protein AC739_08545 [Planococcus glaciei]